jgi:hypothetical protein
MAARCALLVIGLLLAVQSPGLAKAKSHHAARAVPGSGVHFRAKSKLTSAVEAASRAAEQPPIKTEVHEEPAVLLEPDGTEDDGRPSRALYTESDDVG